MYGSYLAEAYFSVFMLRYALIPHVSIADIT